LEDDDGGGGGGAPLDELDECPTGGGPMTPALVAEVEVDAPDLMNLATWTCSSWTREIDVMVRSTLVCTAPRSLENLSIFCSMDWSCSANLVMDSINDFFDCTMYATRN
jgi:hypothetical protein